MQLPPPALEQALIGRVPHQRVLEVVNGFRRLATAEQEPGLRELGERMLQWGPVASNRRTPQGMGDLTPEARADLPDLFHRRPRVEPRHQRVLKGLRDGERRKGPVE